MKLVTRTFNGTKVEITVNESGEFRAKVGTDWLEDTTLRGLENKIKKSTRKVKVDLRIPATLLGYEWHTPLYGRPHRRHGNGAIDILLRGIHAGTGNLVISDDVPDAEKEQASGYGFVQQIVGRMTPQEVVEYVSLKRARDAAEKAYEAFKFKRKYDAVAVVEQALADLVDDPKEPTANESEDPR